MPVLLSLKRDRRGQIARVCVNVAHARPSEVHASLSVTGAYRDERRTHEITYPVEPLVVDELRQKLGDALIESDEVRAWRAEYQTRAERSATLATLDDVDLSAERDLVPYEARLYPYQRVGALFLAHATRGLLADETGTGKTLQSLAASQLLGAQRVVIVTPNIVKAHWRHHIEEWLHETCSVAEADRAQRLDALRARVRYRIVNHAMLRDAAYVDLLSDTDLLIIDEAHLLQSRKAQQSAGALDLARAVPVLYLLTGTPVWNKPESFWNILHLLEPKRFRSYWRFLDEYCDLEVTPWSKEVLGYKAGELERLRSILVPLMLRRKKADVLKDLPEKVRVTVDYTMTTEQEARHEQAYALLPLERLHTQRRTLNWPEEGERDPKVETVLALLETCDVHESTKAVVFVWHKDYANKLVEILRDMKYAPVLVTGDTPRVKRDERMMQFNSDPKTRVLVATIAAVGIGIDLVAASVAIFAESSYVSVHNQQAEGRLHRIGQKTTATIYRVQADGSIEATINALCDERQEMADSTLALQELLVRVNRSMLSRFSGIPTPIQE